MHKALRAGIVAVSLLAAAGVALASGTCTIVRGTQVTLFGGVDDPDVLVWDSRTRLISYAGGSSDTRRFLLPHAMLNRPGTKAVVQYCEGGSVHPKFHMDAADAVGVLILSGKYRGRYGWVSSSDLRGPGVPQQQDPW
jgi:hypothetical protein